MNFATKLRLLSNDRMFLALVQYAFPAYKVHIKLPPVLGVIFEGIELALQWRGS